MAGVTPLHSPSLTILYTPYTLCVIHGMATLRVPADPNVNGQGIFYVETVEIVSTMHGYYPHGHYFH